jgi:hypothetical protein
MMRTHHALRCVAWMLRTPHQSTRPQHSADAGAAFLVGWLLASSGGEGHDQIIADLIMKTLC